MTKNFQELHRRRLGRAVVRRVFREREPGRHDGRHRPLSALRRRGRRARRRRRRKRGFELWRRTPAPARGDVLRRVGDLMTKRKEEIADLMTREMGKPLTETRGDVQEGIDTAYYAATEGRRLFGHTVPSELREQVGDELPPADRRLRASSRRSTSRWRFRRGRCFRRCSAETRASSSRPRTCRTRATCSSRSCSRRDCRRRSSSSCTARARTSARRSSNIPTIPVDLVHRLDGDGTHRRRDLRPDAQAPVARDGRQERDDRAGRRRPRSGARGRAVGRVRHDGPALHGDEPAHPAGRAFTTTSSSRLVDRARGAEARRRPEEGHRRWPAHQRGVACRRSSSYVDIGQAEGADLLCGGKRADGQGARRTASSSSRRSSRACEPGMRLEQEEIFGPVLSVIRVRDAGRGVRGQQRREVRAVVVGLYARRERRVPGVERAGQRHHVHQRADDRRRGTPAVRRGKADRERAPRRRWEVYEFYSETKVGYCDFSGALQRAQIDNYLGTPD